MRQCQCVLGVLLTGGGGAVDAESGDGFLAGVLKQLRHQQVIVLHAHRELLHVCR